MDHSPQLIDQVGFYGSADNTGSHTEVGLRFINANSKSKSDDLGPIGECCISLIGTIGTRDGRNSAFAHFRLLEPRSIRLVRCVPKDWPVYDAEESWLMRVDPPKIEHPQWYQSYMSTANFHTAKYIRCGLSDRQGKQIGLDDQGFAMDNCLRPRGLMPAGSYYATITTEQASQVVPFHVQLLVGNPMVQIETTQISKHHHSV